MARYRYRDVVTICFVLYDMKKQRRLKMQKRRIKHSIYMKLLLVFFAATLPVYLCCYLLVNLSVNELYVQKTNAMRSFLDNGIERLDTEMGSINNAQRFFLTDDIHVVMLAYRYHSMTPFEVGTSVQQINKELRSIKNVSPLIEEVSIYIPNISRELSTTTYYDDNIRKDRVAYYLQTLPLPQGTLQQINGAYFMSGLSSQISNSVMPVYILNIRFSPDALNRMLTTFGDTTYTYVSLSGSDWALSYNNDANLPEQVKGLVKKDVDHFGRMSKAGESAVITDFQFNRETFVLGMARARSLSGVLSLCTPELKIVGNLRTYQRYALFLGLASGVMAIVLVFALFLVIKRPMNRLIGIFAEVETGNLDVNLATHENDEFGYLLHAFGNMLDRLKNMIDRVYVQDINLKRSELKQLQAQINLHFLYNTFNILTQSIKRYDQETALQMSRYLAEYFNYMTKNNAEDESLGKEFVFAETYLKIQKIRFKDRVDIRFDMIGEAYGEIIVPRMILQPLVENAYKHGLDDRGSGGIIHVSWTAYEDRLSISVADNGKGVSPDRLAALQESLKNGVQIGHDGLLNVHQRLSMRYQKDFGLSIDSVEGSGFTATILIPLEMEDVSNVQCSDCG